MIPSTARDRSSGRDSQRVGARVRVAIRPPPAARRARGINRPRAIRAGRNRAGPARLLALGRRLNASPDAARPTSSSRPDPATSAASIPRRGRDGVILRTRSLVASAPSNSWTNSSPWPPASPRRLAFAAARRRRASASEECREASHLPADRQALGGGDADPDAGEAAGADTDEDRSARRPSSSSAIIGTSRSAWPRPISSSRCAMQVPEPSSRAAVQAAVDVSSTRIMSCSVNPAMGHRRAQRQANGRSDRLDRLDLGHIMPDQALDAVLQGHRRGRAARAGAVQREIDRARP